VREELEVHVQHVQDLSVGGMGRAELEPHWNAGATEDLGFGLGGGKELEVHIPHVQDLQWRAGGDMGRGSSLTRGVRVAGDPG
jgi:hypothetical protein